MPVPELSSCASPVIPGPQGWWFTVELEFAPDFMLLVLDVVPGCDIPLPVVPVDVPALPPLELPAEPPVAPLCASAHVPVLARTTAVRMVVIFNFISVSTLLFSCGR